MVLIMVCFSIHTENRFAEVHSQPPVIDGGGISRSSFQQLFTGTFTRNHLFTGINIGRSVISRIEADLSDAEFVSSFDHTDNFVYFFLRETAIEDE
ncbi:hypothetical protein OS493_002445 [Desmophyllum pertusum]|uniref:Uncharacterized protein n=1 Tax=Desmophyllum pertusum TaxID=174260 RepID=A0A9X0CPM5_9CNID|nr:hypothetical protein OS493_002445 [Desmophyllum pertusum]